MESSEWLREAMKEVKEIKAELVKLNTGLALTVERQSVATRRAEDVEDRLVTMENHLRACPARRSYESKSFILKDWTAVIALVVSVIAIYKTFF